MPKRNLNGLEIGKRIGKRVIQEIIIPQKGRTKIKAKCDCGNEDIISAHLLKQGCANQCLKCSAKSNSDKKINNIKYVNNIKGKKFGRWVVIKFEGTSLKPRKTWWLCKCECGNVKRVDARMLKAGKSKSCGCIIKEKKKREHKSKPFKTKQGYLRVYRPEHPNSDKNGSLPEHVYVMSKYINRMLAKDESVHHKNGIRDDNRIENLELWSKAHPFGQRVEDKIKFYIKQLLIYRPEVINLNRIGDL